MAKTNDLMSDLDPVAAHTIQRRPPHNIYAAWDHSGDYLGQGSAGTVHGNRLQFEPVIQKPGVVPFKTKR